MKDWMLLALVGGLLVGCPVTEDATDDDDATEEPFDGILCEGDALQDDVPLNDDHDAFVARFDANQDMVRLMFLGEPYCGPCQNNARRLGELLGDLEDDRLRVDTVWTPAWSLDDEIGAARDQTEINRDPRERIWFDQEAEISYGVSDKVPGQAPVYDKLMIWAPGRTWGEEGDDALPTPDVHWGAGWTPEEVTEALDELYPVCDRIDLM